MTHHEMVGGQEAGRQGSGAPGMAPQGSHVPQVPYGPRPSFDELDNFFFGNHWPMDHELERMQRHMMAGMGRMHPAASRGGPFDTSFFAERPLADFGAREAFMDPWRYANDLARMGPDSYRSPRDMMRRWSNAMMGGNPCHPSCYTAPPYLPYYYHPHHGHPHHDMPNHATPCMVHPPAPAPSQGYPSTTDATSGPQSNGQFGFPSGPQSGQQQSGQQSGAPWSSSSAPQAASSGEPKGRWATETMEGIWDGEGEPIIKKTRSSFNTDGGILRRETQKRIGDRTLNVLKTKKIAHPAELAQNLTWDSETRSRPKNDAFTAEWKDAKKKLTQGQAYPQHPPANTHKALFNNMNQQAINAPKASP